MARPKSSTAEDPKTLERDIDDNNKMRVHLPLFTDCKLIILLTMYNLRYLWEEISSKENLREFFKKLFLKVPLCSFCVYSCFWVREV